MSCRTLRSACIKLKDPSKGLFFEKNYLFTEIKHHIKNIKSIKEKIILGYFDKNNQDFFKILISTKANLYLDIIDKLIEETQSLHNEINLEDAKEASEMIQEAAWNIPGVLNVASDIQT